MTAAERAIADVLTFRRHWGDAWALERIEWAALEMAQEAARSRSHMRYSPAMRNATITRERIERIEALIADNETLRAALRDDIERAAVINAVLWLVEDEVLRATEPGL